MVSKTTKRRRRQLDKVWCEHALDVMTTEDFVKLEAAPHPKIPDSELTAFDYALWCSSRGYIGGMYNLFREHEMPHLLEALTL